MFKRRVSIIPLLLLTTGIATAQDRPTWYAGFGIGQSDLRTTDGVVLPSNPPQTTSISESDDLTKVYLAFRPIQYFALEGSLFAGGDIREIVGESTPGAGDGFEFAADTSGYDLSVLGILPLADGRVDLFLRLGVQRGDYRIGFRDPANPDSADNFKETIKQTNRLYGVGIQGNFGDRRQYSVRLEGNVVDTKDILDELTEVLLSFNFGWGGN